MDEDIPLPFDLPAVAGKKVSAAFDGGRITSDGGVMLLAQAERRLGIADRLASAIAARRSPPGWSTSRTAWPAQAVSWLGSRPCGGHGCPGLVSAS